MTYHSRKRGPIEQIRSALIGKRMDEVASLLQCGNAYRVAFEQLEPAELIDALPLVGNREVGEFVAHIIAHKCPGLRKGVVDVALRAGNKKLAQKIIDRFLTGASCYLLDCAAQWYVKDGVGKNLLREQARTYWWCVQRVFDHFSPQEQAVLWDAIGQITITG